MSEPLWPDHLNACLRQAAVGTAADHSGEKWCPAREGGSSEQAGAVMEKLVRASSAASGR